MILKRLLGIVLTLSVAGGSMADSRDGLTPSVKTFLKTQKLISVATKRANGDWSRPAPIWFTYEDGAVYFITAPTSFKARRIRKGSPVLVWLDEKQEPAFSGETQIVTDPVILDRINAAYQDKYWVAWLTYWAMPLAGRIQAGNMVAVRITPRR